MTLVTPSQPRGALTLPLFSTASMRDIFSDAGRVEAMLAFEAALARAEAAHGVIPSEAAGVIAAACTVQDFDLAAIADGAWRAGNLAIPLVGALVARVTARDPRAADYVHLGVTSQDAIDTGLVLQLQRGVALLRADVGRLRRALATLSEAHARTPMIGRTWLQAAVPITFGLKAAGWLSALMRCEARLSVCAAHANVLQLGGAAGTLAALGDAALDVAATMGEALGLQVPDAPWHAHRDRLVDLASAVAILVGGLGKMARDLSLLMQTEVAEASEPSAPERGGSSAMPQKQNPIACAVALEAAIRIPPLVSTLLSALPTAHERDLGGWQAEWDVVPEIMLLAAGALAAMIEAMEGLHVDAERMQRNLDATGGLIMAEALTMALMPAMGKRRAREAVELACRRARDHHEPLRSVAAHDPTIAEHLTPDRLDRLFAPDAQTGLAPAFVARVLAAHRSLE